VIEKSQRRCVFCDTPITKTTASREDTVPQWLQADLAIANERVEPTLTSPSGEQLEQRIHPVDQLRTGGICKACNNGWMSQLESEAIPILRPLITTQRMLRSLNRAERHTLARWAAKTAFVLDFGGLESRVPRSHVSQLYLNAPHLPSGVYVFARQQQRTRPWYFIETGSWSHAQIDEPSAELVKRESYKIAMQFGDLILYVAFWPLLGWGMRIEKGELAKVWPPLAVVKDYEHPHPPNVAASEDACIRYATSISVVPHRGAAGYVRRQSRK
jgi:hypothetical protein